jgi:hypothetical protein
MGVFRLAIMFLVVAFLAGCGGASSDTVVSDQPRHTATSQRGVETGVSQPTLHARAPVPTSTPFRRAPLTGGDVDCNDFETHRQAQTFYEDAGGPDRDPYRLDRDRDGIACEALP